MNETETKPTEEATVLETKVVESSSEISTPKKSKKGLIIFAVIAALLICIVTCVLISIFVIVPAFVIKSDKSSNITVTPTISSQISISPTDSIIQKFLDSISTRNANEFFPTTFGSLNIRSTGVENYLIGPVMGDYQLNSTTTDESKIANIKAGYHANYGPETQAGQTIIAEKTVGLAAYKFDDSNETLDAKSISENVFNNLPSGFSKVTIPVDSNIEYWAAYQSVPASSAAESYSGDARILFKDSNILILITTYGGYTKSEFQTVIKNYFDALKEPSTLYVLTDSVMTNDIYQEYLKNDK